MRNVLVGAVESTRVALEAMCACGHPPELLVTLPPERAARHSDYVELGSIAARAGVPVLHAPQVNAPGVVARIGEAEPGLLWVIGWSQICGPELLALASGGAVGYHPAPLPRMRGRAVIPWTILLGETETGSTLFWMDEGMDSGDVLAQERFPVAPEETAASLYRKHMRALDTMLADVLPRLAAGDAPRRPQDHTRATFCARRTADDGWIEWTRPAREVWRLVRAAGEPYPGAFTYLGSRRVVVWEADLAGRGPYHGLPGQVQAVGPEGARVKCGDGEDLLLRVVQPEGAERVEAGGFFRNHAKLGVDVPELMRRLNGGSG